MKILIATPEAVPYIKTGGLADVAGALCRELRGMHCEAHLVLPLYRKIRETVPSLEDTGITIKVPVGSWVVEGQIFSDEHSNYFIACDDFFDREEPYGTPDGDYADNASRFVFFSRGIFEACRALDFRPDIIHCNDWQTGLVPLYLKMLYSSDAFFRDTSTVLTLHNLGYQGVFPASQMPLTNLGWKLFTPEGIEFYGKVNFLKAGILAADILTTVSGTYAKEILSSEHGFGLDGLLRTRESDLYGVINGIDYGEWDPANDVFLPASFHHENISGKSVCKKELMKSLFKKADKQDLKRIPLLGMVGRLSGQKGLDLVFQSVPELLSSGAKLVVLGKGDERFHRGFLSLQEQYRDKMSVTIGFDDSLAHRIYAGADFFIMPSQYEPCGLGQLMSLRYGCIPVARKTGGLADTIQDFEPLASRGTGFLFTDYTPSAFLDALKRAFCVFTDSRKMNRMITEGMKQDFSWRSSVERYCRLYEQSLGKKRPLRIP
jgi:starch synthase